MDKHFVRIEGIYTFNLSETSMQAISENNILQIIYPILRLAINKD